MIGLDFKLPLESSLSTLTSKPKANETIHSLALLVIARQNQSNP